MDLDIVLRGTAAPMHVRDTSRYMVAPRKRPREDALVAMGRGTRGSHVSQRGIHRILKAVEEEGLPEHYSRATQYRHRKKMCAARTDYGRLVENIVLSNGSTVAVQNPLAMLYTCAEKSEKFADLLARTVAQTESPLNIILYLDGITPADALTKADGRKITAIYWSFLEFGPKMLSSEDVWFCVACTRLTITNELDGQISNLLYEIMTRFFFNLDGPNFFTTGMLLPNVPLILKAQLGVILGDEPALHDAILCKGHAGLRCCCLCNVVLKKFYKPSMRRFCAPHTCIKWAKVTEHTDEFVKGLMHRLKECSETETKGKLEHLETIMGFTYVERSLLGTDHLNIGITMVMYDWFHTYLNNGLLDVEIGQCMKALKTAGYNSYADFLAFAQAWKWPKVCGDFYNRLSDLLAPSRVKKYLGSKNAKPHLSVDASDLLNILPVLMHFILVEVQPEGACKRKVKSLLLCMSVVDMLQAVRAECGVTPEMLRDAIDTHYICYRKTYGVAEVRPKHHYARHLWRMLEKFDVLISCFVHERHHKVIKRHAKLRMCTKSYEQGIVEECTLDHIYSLQSPDVWNYGLQGSHAPKRQLARVLLDLFPSVPLADVRVANSIDYARGSISTGDVCTFDDDGNVGVAEVLLHYAVGNDHMSIVCQWHLVGLAYDADQRACKCIVKSEPSSIRADAIGHACIYKGDKDAVESEVIVILPSNMR